MKLKLSKYRTKSVGGLYDRYEPFREAMYRVRLHQGSLVIRASTKLIKTGPSLRALRRAIELLVRREICEIAAD